MIGLIAKETLKVDLTKDRMIRLPEEFCNKLDFEYDLTLDIHEEHIVIRPVPKDPHAFYEKILTEVINEGFKNKKLITEVRNRLSNEKGIARAIAADARSQREDVKHEARMRQLEEENRRHIDDWRYSDGY